MRATADQRGLARSGSRKPAKAIIGAKHRLREVTRLRAGASVIEARATFQVQ